MHSPRPTTCPQKEPLTLHKQVVAESQGVIKVEQVGLTRLMQTQIWPHGSTRMLSLQPFPKAHNCSSVSLDPLQPPSLHWSPGGVPVGKRVCAFRKTPGFPGAFLRTRVDRTPIFTAKCFGAPLPGAGARGCGARGGLGPSLPGVLRSCDGLPGSPGRGGASPSASPPVSRGRSPAPTGLQGSPAGSGRQFSRPAAALGAASAALACPAAVTATLQVLTGWSREHCPDCPGWSPPAGR